MLKTGKIITASVLAIIFIVLGVGVLYISEDGSSDVLVNNDDSAINPSEQKDFVFAFYSEITEKDEKSNIFFSPLSISTAFSMAYEGAKENTASEMQQVFGFESDDAKRQKAISELLSRFNHKDDWYNLQVANALWIKDGYEIKQNYIDTAKTHYSSTADNVDFVTDDGINKINSWVKEKTNDKIESILAPGSTDDSTRMVITNAVYFKGKWSSEFNPRNTSEKLFWTDKDNSVTVYGIDESFSVDQNSLVRKEIPAKHFNPILGVFLPAAARLVLAAAESIVTSYRDGYVAYMDTDSIMVSPKHAQEIQKFFQKLNPYNSNDVQIMKIEKSDDGKLLENVLFFGVSSKRYVLFEYDNTKNKFNIHKFTSHGLAHLLDVDTERWWQDILAMHYSPGNKQEILDKYNSKYAVSKMSITTPNVLKRFPNLRPFNKILVGAGYKLDENGNVIIPTLPYLDAKNRECIQYMPFTNYTTGEKFQDSADTTPYWKPLSETLDDYADHRETKSGGDVGLLPRLRTKMDKNQIKYVGKEVANLDASNILGVTSDESCTVYDNLEKKILEIRPRDSCKFGISRSNLMAIQKKIRSKDAPSPKLQSKTIEKLKQVFSGNFPENSRKNHRKNAEIMIAEEVN